jgi:hypothetical protein
MTFKKINSVYTTVGPDCSEDVRMILSGNFNMTNYIIYPAL